MAASFLRFSRLASVTEPLGTVSGLEISLGRSEGPDFVGEKGVLERLTSASDVDFSFKELGFRSGLGRECFLMKALVKNHSRCSETSTKLHTLYPK